MVVGCWVEGEESVVIRKQVCQESLVIANPAPRPPSSAVSEGGQHGLCTDGDMSWGASGVHRCQEGALLREEVEGPLLG